MLSLFRIIKFSFQDIVRNVWLSIVTVTILILALFSINMLLTVRLISTNAIQAVKEKMNISLYFTTDANETDIMDVRNKVSSWPEVKSVNFISKDQALQSFRDKYQNNPGMLSALQLLDKNPLAASLTITPVNLDDSSQLINDLKFLQSDAIASRDFSDNSSILNKINSITGRINEIGLFLILIFVLTSILVVYNSMRVAIYTHRQEIEIMRLVGASNFFIYMPYLVSAFVYALLAILTIIVIFFPFLSLLQPYLETFFASYDMNLIVYFLNNFWVIFGGQFLAVLVINGLASLLAARKYAKI
jgi:cell division transport system permease protein